MLYCMIVSDMQESHSGQLRDISVMTQLVSGQQYIEKAVQHLWGSREWGALGRSKQHL